MKNKPFDLIKEIQEISERIDGLKDKINFYEEENEEDAYDAIENCIINLEEFQEIAERDEEYRKVKKMLEE